jgi:hypothetical protein
MTSRSLLLISVIACVLSLSVSSAAGQTFAPIFDKRYVRSGGTPVRVSDTFAACDPSGAFRLIVVNGPGSLNEIASDPLSSGSVSVNGVEVVRESDLSQHVTRVERVLTGIASSNRVDVAIRSGPAGAIQVTVEAAQACGFRITSPAPGSMFRPGNVVVRGTLPSQPGVDAGVSVNGYPAAVEGTHFAARVPVGPGVTGFAAELNTFAGTQARDTVAVSVTPTGEDPMTLRANRPGGVAPFNVEFRLGWLVPVSQVVLDADNDGTTDFQGASLDRFPFTYTRPGVYVPVARVTDNQGATHNAMTVVHVMDQAAMDARLQTVWTGFKDSLRAGDLVGALRFLHSGTRSQYEAQLARLSPAALAGIDKQMTGIQLVDLGFGGAEYEMLRSHDGQTRSFAVWFNVDHDGLWRLRRF